MVNEVIACLIGFGILYILYRLVTSEDPEYLIEQENHRIEMETDYRVSVAETVLSDLANALAIPMNNDSVQSFNDKGKKTIFRTGTDWIFVYVSFDWKKRKIELSFSIVDENGYLNQVLGILKFEEVLKKSVGYQDLINEVLEIREKVIESEMYEFFKSSIKEKLDKKNDEENIDNNETKDLE